MTKYVNKDNIQSLLLEFRKKADLRYAESGALPTIASALMSLQSQVDAVASRTGNDEFVASVLSSDILTTQMAYIKSIDLDGLALTKTKVNGYDTHVGTTNGNPHGTTFGQINSKPTSISGYGITDAYTKSDIDTSNTTISDALKSLQSQVDAVASRNAFDEVCASVVHTDILSAQTIYGGNMTITGNITPNATDVSNLGTSSLRFSYVYGRVLQNNKNETMYVWQAANQPLVFGVNNAERMRIATNGDMSLQGSIATTGNVVANGAVTALSTSTSSDIRLKTAVETLEDDCLEYVLGTRYVRFRWRENSQKSIGIIAQEEENRKYGHLVKQNGEYLSYEYGLHTAILGKALQEEHKRVLALEEDVRELKEVVSALCNILK